MKTTFKFSALAATLMVAVFVIYPTSTFAAEPGWYPKVVDYNFVEPYAVIPTRDDVVIIDSRPMKRRFANGHIPGAISIPDSQFNKMAATALPKDKSMVLIFYCGGEKCMLSHKSAFKAEKLGYTNIQVYAAGYPEWKAKGRFGSVSASYVKKVIDTQKATVVDVRPMKRRYAKGHVPGAISMPTSQFDKMVDVLPADKKSPLLFYCGGMKCPLSPKSALKAKALGYTNIMLFQGGYPEWKMAYGEGAMGNEPFEMAKAGAIEAGPDGDTITVASFNAILKDKPDSVHFYDVRDATEYAKGSIPGAVNLPVEDIEAKMDTLPTDKPIVFVCSTGARSGEAYDIVKMLKEDMKVYFLDATITYHGEGKYDLAQN
ncbi:MAG: rhodanese-like domain-containing protein [Rhodospirillales bacterium]|nr:rhodanese-like domain-containing protein [Rhodospirillales bacterium]